MKKLDIFVVASLFVTGLLFIPFLMKIGEISVPFSEYSIFSGLSLASFYVIWRWFNDLRKLSSIPEANIAFSLSVLILIPYAIFVYVIGTFRPAILFVVYRTGFIVIHSAIMSIASLIVYLIGFCAEDTERSRDVRGDLIRVLTSTLMSISLMSIAVTFLLSGRILESTHQRAVLMCGYGFLAVAFYSLAYICAELKIVKVNALCFLLSGLFGFFFGMIISLTGPFNVYMFSFSVQALLIIGLFIANNYIEQTLHYLRRIRLN